MSRLRNKGMGPAILRAILMVTVLIFTTVPVRAAEFTGTSDYKNNNLHYIYVDDAAKNFEQSQAYLNRPLGIAGNFHIVAFGDAILKADTDGNILAGNLTAEAGFGSKDLKEEVSYAGTVKVANTTMGAQESTALYVGNNNTVDLADTGDAFRLQGIQLNRPKVLGKDSDTVKYVDLESLYKNVVEQSTTYENLEGASVDYKADRSNPVITIGDASGINTMTIPVTDLQNSDAAFKVQGFTQEGTGCLIINVDAAGQSSITLPQIEMMAGDVPVGIDETSNFKWGRILLNVYDSTALDGQYAGTIHTNKPVTASILAPAASVTVGASLNGNIIAQNVTVNAETHRMDFLGTQSLEESNASVNRVQEAERMALQAAPSVEAVTSDDMAMSIQSAEAQDINKSLSYNKTATVNSWDDRTYTIHLDASSLMTETSTVTTPYDIVLVLDVSGSMGDTFQTYQKVSSTSLSYGNTYFVKTPSGIYEQVSLGWSDVYYITYYDTATSSWVQKPASEAQLYSRQYGSYTTKIAALRSSAKAFVDSVRSKSPDSRIGIVTFSGSASTKIRSDNKSLLRIGNPGSYTQLNSWIDGLNAGGATNSAAGMSNAKTLLENTAVWENVNQGSGREKMVVFLTDGVPTQYSSFDNGVAQGAINAADSIVANNNASIYSLGVFDSANYYGSII
ncbi:MAG: VWA domain-containing protein, partial [Eubacterium sp.]